MLQFFSTVFLIKASYGRKFKTSQWPVDLSNVSLERLKSAVHETLTLSENISLNDMTLHFDEENNKQYENLSLKDDETLREYLRSFAIRKSLALKILVYTLQKPYSEWKFRSVCKLFGLPTDFRDFTKFVCETDPLVHSTEKDALKHLCKELQLRYDVIRGTISPFVIPFLVAATSLFKGKLKLHVQEQVEGKYGRGPMDFCLHLQEVIIVVVEVKKDDFSQGVAQATLQLHSSLEVNQVCVLLVIAYKANILNDFIDKSEAKT